MDESQLDVQQIRTFVGNINNNAVWNVYTVGRTPVVLYGHYPFLDEVIERIIIHRLDRTIAAEVYYPNGLDYIEDVKHYLKIYDKD